MDSTKEYHYAIYTHYSDDRLLGHVWWDGKSIQTDSEDVTEFLKEKPAGYLSFHDGKEYLKRLPHRFNNGYVSLQKVK